jgi:hypothetical protein
MKKQERHEYVLRRARELAASGQYSGYQLIEHALRQEGYAEARGWLDNDLLRKEIDQICTESRIGKPDAKKP